MDDNRFDAFVCSLDIAIPRRGALVGALGTGLAALLTRIGIETAEAKKRKRKKKCKGGKKKCGKKCIPKASCCKSADCPSGASCVNGGCVCPAGETDCEGTCADLATDGANCGSCGNGCASGEICVARFCLTPCENPSSQNPLTPCPADPGGFCATVDGIAVCVLGEDICPPFARESCDAEPCPDGRVCANLICGLDQFLCACPGGQTVCEDACCEAGLTCVDGQCEDLCPPEFTCPLGQACVNGDCICPAAACAAATAPTDDQLEGCICAATVEGEQLCFASIVCNPQPPTCATSAECGAGFACFEFGCGGLDRCTPLCDVS
jgi:hypothetical protein